MYTSFRSLSPQYPCDSSASSWARGGRLGGSLGLLVVVATEVANELGRGVGRLCVIAAVGAVPGGVCSWRNLEDVSVTTGEGGDVAVVGGGSIKSEMG